MILDPLFEEGDELADVVVEGADVGKKRIVGKLQLQAVDGVCCVTFSAAREVHFSGGVDRKDAFARKRDRPGLFSGFRRLALPRFVGVVMLVRHYPQLVEDLRRILLGDLANLAHLLLAGDCAAEQKRIANPDELQFGLRKQFLQRASELIAPLRLLIVHSLRVGRYARPDVRRCNGATFGNGDRSGPVDCGFERARWSERVSCWRVLAGASLAAVGPAPANCDRVCRFDQRQAGVSVCWRFRRGRGGGWPGPRRVAVAGACRGSSPSVRRRNASSG